MSNHGNRFHHRASSSTTALGLGVSALTALPTTPTNVTCDSCDFSVTQVAGTKRTICPNCGSFYNRHAAHAVRLQHNIRHQRHVSTQEHDQDTDKHGSRLQSIANFFHSLGPNRRFQNSNATTPESSSATELPPLFQDAQGVSKQGPSYSERNQAHTVSSIQDAIRVASVQNEKEHNQYTPRSDIRSQEQLMEAVEQSRETSDWKPVQRFYSTTFETFTDLNNMFKKDPAKDSRATDDPGLKLDYVNTVLDALLEMPQDIQKAVLKAIINSLLTDKRPHTKDDLRAYLILIQNPQFNSYSTFIVFAHLLRQMAALMDHDHHHLVHWFRRIHVTRFQLVLDRLLNFISVRLFPPKQDDLPPLAKCTWWIPSATKVVALLNAANNLSMPAIVNYMTFYNSTIDHLDLMTEYYAWQNPSSHAGFSFCQYPFIMSLTAKRTILQKDSEQQMIIMARKCLVAKVQQRQLPDIGMLFLNLTVRRSHLVSDSLNEIGRRKQDLKKKLKVTFAGEPGLDMGGLTKEWFLLLVRQIFRQEYGMFTYDRKAGVHWFVPASSESYQEFNLVGVLMGLAVYNSIILDIRFPQCCYKKLLNPAVVPYSNPQAIVGLATMTLDDLKQVQPDVARGLQELLDYEGDVEDDLCLTFQISYNELGNVKTHELKPQGKEIPVTQKNRREYVKLYVDWILNKSIYNQFQAFYHGFHSVCASNALIMLRPEEVEMLVCGNPTLDLSVLKKVTRYDGYTSSDQTIRYFWDTVQAFPKDLQKRLLLFTTGSDRIPIGGMSEMAFKISKVNASNLLPMSHTCFNQLILPDYKNRKQLKQKLCTAIQNAEGFGLE